MRSVLTWLGVIGFAVVMGELLFRLLMGFVDDVPLRRKPSVVEGKAGRPLPPDILHAVGFAATHLVPYGFVEIDGNRFPAQSRGEYVEARAPVTVIEVRAQALVVEARESSEF